MMRLMIMEDPAKLEETVDHMGDEAEGGEVEGDSSGVGLGSASSSLPGGKEGPQQKGPWSGPYAAQNWSFNLALAYSQVPILNMRLSG